MAEKNQKQQVVKSWLPVNGQAQAYINGREVFCRTIATSGERSLSKKPQRPRLRGTHDGKELAMRREQKAQRVAKKNTRQGAKGQTIDGASRSWGRIGAEVGTTVSRTQAE